jgi:hypothetical protein
MKIFGREPALVIGAIGAVLTFLAGLNLPGLDAGAASAITALITAGIMAATTRPVAPALFTGVLAAGVAVAAEYGLDVPDSTVAAASAVVVAVFALVARGQVSPASASSAVRPTPAGSRTVAWDE